jgi:hypothetical protein
MYYREAVAAAVEEANALVTKAGVEDIDSFYRFMEANHRSELHEIRDSFARGDGRPLVKAAKEGDGSFGISRSSGSVAPGRSIATTSFRLLSSSAM